MSWMFLRILLIVPALGLRVDEEVSEDVVRNPSDDFHLELPSRPKEHEPWEKRDVAPPVGKTKGNASSPDDSWTSSGVEGPGTDGLSRRRISLIHPGDRRRYSNGFNDPRLGYTPEVPRVRPHPKPGKKCDKQQR
eukprot:TRINITY_DN23675_c0_g1_i1.p1 TRINITY_DN23675_c0_g1~~TRINITY_DN23675_c0_g1_i1.p1  ORF type:complete len:135 (-),score=16.58 TRINITY_DN23675_c0_g1_i1:120-524(-)